MISQKNKEDLEHQPPRGNSDGYSHRKTKSGFKVGFRNNLNGDQNQMEEAQKERKNRIKKETFVKGTSHGNAECLSLFTERY